MPSLSRWATRQCKDRYRNHWKNSQNVSMNVFLGFVFDPIQHLLWNFQLLIPILTWQFIETQKRTRWMLHWEGSKYELRNMSNRLFTPLPRLSSVSERWESVGNEETATHLLTLLRTFRSIYHPSKSVVSPCLILRRKWWRNRIAKSFPLLHSMRYLNVSFLLSLDLHKNTDFHVFIHRSAYQQPQFNCP